MGLRDNNNKIRVRPFSYMHSRPERSDLLDLPDNPTVRSIPDSRESSKSGKGSELSTQTAVALGEKF